MVANVGPEERISWAAPRRKARGGNSRARRYPNSATMALSRRLAEFAERPGKMGPPGLKLPRIGSQKPSTGQRARAENLASAHRQGRMRMHPPLMFFLNRNLITRTGVWFSASVHIMAFGVCGAKVVSFMDGGAFARRMVSDGTRREKRYER